MGSNERSARFLIQQWALKSHIHSFSLAATSGAQDHLLLRRLPKWCLTYTLVPQQGAQSLYSKNFLKCCRCFSC